MLHQSEITSLNFTQGHYEKKVSGKEWTGQSATEISSDSNIPLLKKEGPQKEIKKGGGPGQCYIERVAKTIYSINCI